MYNNSYYQFKQYNIKGMGVRKNFLILFCTFFVCLSSVFAGDQLTSLSWPDDTPLYVLETGDSPYFIDSSFVVEAGNILIIEPNVTLLFGAGAGLIVKGRLKADGKRGRTIHFTARDKRRPWNGIYFDSAEKISQLKYCVITHAQGVDPDSDSIELPGRLGGAVSAINSNVKIEFCIITHNTADKGGAVFAHDSELYFKGNIIRRNTCTEGGACYFYLTKALFISNKIEKNRASNIAGAILSFDSDLTFIRNRIVSNKAAVEGGIYQEGSKIEYKFNNISRNRGKKADKDFIAEIIKDRPGKRAEEEYVKLETEEKEKPPKTPEQIKKEIVDSLAYINKKAYLPRKYSPYQITQNIVIKPGGQLEIQPGTVLEMSPRTGIIVEGTLIARGKKTRKIYFQGRDGKNTWQNMVFFNSSGENIIEWCVIANGSGRILSAGTDKSFNAGGACAVINSTLSIKNTSFELNKADYGGALYSENAVLSMENNSFQKNKAGKEGGAIYARLSELILSNNDFFENEAKENGGVIYLFKSESEIIANNIYQNTVPQDKGIILCRGSRPKIRNNQILKNTGRRIVVEPESAEIEKRQLRIKK